MTALILTSYLPWGILIALIPLFFGIAWRKLGPVKDTLPWSVPVGMLFTFALFPFLAWLWGEPQVIFLTLSSVLLLLIIRRLTADIIVDLRHKHGREVASILINRFLYDRSYRERYH